MLKLLGLLAVFALVGAAVNLLGNDDATVATGGGASESGGSFLVSGSSTVFPIVQRQAEEYKIIDPSVAIAVEGPGSGDGAKKFCAGEVPIANASREFKDEEIVNCEANGIEFIELRRAIDGISVITSVENDLVECVSFNELYALISAEALDFASWSDANTLTQDWDGRPFDDVPLSVFGPGEESGTFDSFAEIVIEGVAKGKTGLDTEAREFEEDIRPDYTSSPDDNVVVEGVQASQYSLGWVGFAYAQESAAAGRAKLLRVKKEDSGECVAPTAESIAAADFPISRFLYTYVNLDAAENEAGVAAFVDYMLSDTGLESVSAVGYIDLPADELAKSATTWETRATGRQYE